MATTPGFVGDVLDAVTAGRVETLIVHDDGTPGDERYVDRCIAAALSTGASIRVVPNVTALRDGVGACSAGDDRRVTVGPSSPT